VSTGERPKPPPPSAAAQAWSDRIVAAAAELRLPSLFVERAGALVRAERHGIATVALPTHALADGELRAIMQYRLAQYLSVRFVDGERIHALRLEHEPLAHAGPDDVHVLTGAADSGELLCYCVVKGLKDAAAGVAVRSNERAPFPVEEVHGRGIYQRLVALPDIEAARVRELGRFVKNQAVPTLEERLIRGVVEIGVGLWRLLRGPWAAEVEAVVGDFEEGVAMQNLAFFHMPLVVLHGTVPYEAEDAWLHHRYRYRTVFPFALLVSDLERCEARVAEIEAALELPGFDAIVTLAELREDRRIAPSSLVPPGGLPEVAGLEALVQHETEMSDRFALVEAGERLRSVDLFSDLSTAEAAVVGTLFERLELAAEETAVRRGDEADALFLVESGALEVRAGGEPLARLGPGDAFGEIGLVAHAPRSADVVAVEPATVLRLDRERYLTFLGSLPDVRVRAAASTVERLRDGGGSLLATLARGDAALLGSHMEQLAVQAGETIVRAGDEPDGFYLVVSGEVEVRGERLGPGEFFGELALLDGTTRSADVVAAVPTTLLRLDRPGFDAFARYSDAVAQAAASRRSAG
jgi:CRP-like cAMP-binding protein